MRIIAGEFRSRALQAPRGMATRPTSDRLRETLFNVLSTRVEGATFLDLYAGSGAVGLEAISRGARIAVFVEPAPPAVATIRANIAALAVAAQTRIEPTKAARALEALRKRGETFHLVFLDPPYDAAEEYEGTLQALARGAEELLQPDAVIIAEHSRKHTPPERVGSLHRTRILQQGDAALSFYRVAPPQD